MTVNDHFENQPIEATRTLSGRNGQNISVVLNTEHTLQLYGEGRLLHTFVCSPSALAELCAGWLLTQGCSAEALDISADGCTAVAKGLTSSPKAATLRRETATTGEMLRLFREASDGHSRSHGVHECVLKGIGWHILAVDIGRHNAIDKAIGAAALAGYDPQGATIFTSGRISLQTVEKAVRCGIGCLMSKAVASEQAISLAEEAGLRLLFSVKGEDYITL